MKKLIFLYFFLYFSVVKGQSSHFSSNKKFNVKIDIDTLIYKYSRNSKAIFIKEYLIHNQKQIIYFDYGFSDINKIFLNDSLYFKDQIISNYSKGTTGIFFKRSLLKVCTRLKIIKHGKIISNQILLDNYICLRISYKEKQWIFKYSNNIPSYDN